MRAGRRSVVTCCSAGVGCVRRREATWPHEVDARPEPAAPCLGSSAAPRPARSPGSSRSSRALSVTSTLPSSGARWGLRSAPASRWWGCSCARSGPASGPTTPAVRHTATVSSSASTTWPRAWPVRRPGTARCSCCSPRTRSSSRGPAPSCGRCSSPVVWTRPRNRSRRRCRPPRRAPSDRWSPGRSCPGSSPTPSSSRTSHNRSLPELPEPGCSAAGSCWARCSGPLRTPRAGRRRAWRSPPPRP